MPDEAVGLPEVEASAATCTRCLGTGRVKGAIMPKVASDPAPTIGDVLCPDCNGGGRDMSKALLSRPSTRGVVVSGGGSTVVVQ